MYATDTVARGRLEGAETTAYSGPGDVLQPNLSLYGVLWEGVKSQFPVPM
uniref:Uncharacterized protein n=1 Tax=Anguilla anguilla TaxID=7936 RepID=A0A0E9RLB9_ANGAN